MDRIIELLNALTNRPIAVLTVRRERIVTVRGVLRNPAPHHIHTDSVILISAAGETFWLDLASITIDIEACTISFDARESPFVILFLDYDLSYVREALTELAYTIGGTP